MSDKLFLLLLIFVLQMVSPAPTQSDREFVDNVRNFKLILVRDWQPLAYTDAIGRRKIDFIFRNHNEGLLEIARENLSGFTLADKIKNDLDDLELNQTFLYRNTESFESSQFTALCARLGYMDGARKVIGTFYYLQDGDTVWILRFTGKPDSPAIAADITDKMARSFCTICQVP